MLIRHSATSRRSTPTGAPAFTLIEVVLITALLVILSLVTLRSMLAFNEQRKLRSAAVELAGYLEVARATASARNAQCTIALSAANGGTFEHNGTTECPGGAMPPKVGLGGAAGSQALKATVIQGSYPLTFNPEGTITQPTTVSLSSNTVPDGAWCVDVQPPLATVRIGWQQGDGACNYAVEQ